MRVLVAGDLLRLVPDRAVAHRLHTQKLEMQQEFARLSTPSQLSVLEDSSPFIISISPRL
jgi:hypothetical protein